MRFDEYPSNATISASKGLNLESQRRRRCTFCRLDRGALLPVSFLASFSRANLSRLARTQLPCQHLT